MVTDVFVGFLDVQGWRGISLSHTEFRRDALADEEDGPWSRTNVYTADLEVAHSRERQRHQVAGIRIEPIGQALPESSLKAVKCGIGESCKIIV